MGIPCAKTCILQLVYLTTMGEMNSSNGISDLKNDLKNNHNQIELVVKYMFWHCGGNKIFDY